MSLKLVQVLHDALNSLAREEHKRVDDNASVLVQFAAGEWSKIRGALAQAKVDLDWKDLHAIADAAGVPSHSETGQPLPVETRVDLAAATLPADEVTAPPGTPAPAPEPVPEPVSPAHVETPAEPVPAVPAPGSPPAIELPPA